MAITNQIYSHMGGGKFLFCPTQYCASMAQPDVATSEYLRTIGEKLDGGIDIFWTGMMNTIWIDHPEQDVCSPISNN